jgi:hypothetical protein
LYTLCDIFVVIAVLGLVLPPYTYGKNTPSLSAEGSPADHPSQGDEHRADPCDHLPDPPGEAKGIDKKCPQAGSSSGIAKGDFNGDGFADLAVGVPFKHTPSTVQDSGAVIVIYGSATGLVPAGGSGIPASRFWSQNTPGVPDSSEEGDRFGSALAAGNFNGDRYSDLAIGAPRDAVVANGIANRGQVTVIYGSANGLTTDTSAGVPAPRRFVLSDLNASGQLGPTLVADDESQVPFSQFFGSSLAWGDFNGDTVGDLAVGVPEATVIVPGFLGIPSFVRAGAVGILYGSEDGGLSPDRSQVWTQESPGVEDQPAEGDDFGRALTAGDFNGDGTTDLAIGAPGETESCGFFNTFIVGAVQILYGDEGVGLTAGLTADTDNEFLPLDFFVSRIGGSPCARLDVGIGTALTAGDFDGNGRADLAIGVPFANRSGAPHGGSIFVQSGAAQGLREGETQHFDQNTIFGAGNEDGDQFGSALAAGDFDADGRADLAIGTPFEDVGTVEDAGAVFVVYGSLDGLSTTGRAPQSWHQNVSGIIDAAETRDRFGSSLTAWNFGRNEPFLPQLGIERQITDLAIGVPLENIDGVGDAGAVNVLYGSSANGLTSLNNQFFHSGRADIPGENVTGDRFGSALY